MDVLFFTFIILSIMIGVVLFYNAYKNSKGLFEVEKGKNPILLVQAGGKFGLFNWPIPLVRVAVYPTFIAISCWKHKIVLRKGDVKGVDELLIYFPGLQILHNRNDIPLIIVIWTNDWAKLKALIERHFL